LQGETSAVGRIRFDPAVAECSSAKDTNAEVVGGGNYVTAEILDGAMMNFIALRFHAREEGVVACLASPWNRMPNW
jgi:hypothetical protein